MTMLLVVQTLTPEKAVMENLLFEAQLLEQYSFVALNHFMLHHRRDARMEYSYRRKPQLG